ncbi:MAG: ABC transporter substrate-binding protein [Campylobacterales bacterium]|nr:ABC transporter substrate-binding protein [Campylobacterales bacterium]
MRIFFLLSVLFLNTVFSQELEKVRVQLQWKHQFEFAGFYAAKELGYYQEVGLDVELIEYRSDEGIVPIILNKKAEYGVGYSSVIADFCNGKPIVMLANFFKHSPLVLVVQKEITTPADLKGKTIMGLSDGIDGITLINMLGKFGIDSNDYKNIPTDFKIEKFAKKEVDAMSVFTTNEIYELAKEGIAYNVFNPSLFGQEYYDCNLFTSKEEVLAHPARANALRQATIRGWQYAMSHQEELTELIMKKYNTQAKTKEALLFEAKQIESVLLANIYPIGSIDAQRLRMMANEFKQAGFINSNVEKDISEFLFEPTLFSFDTSAAKSFVHLIDPSYIWQIIALLAIGLVLVLWRNHIAKKLNVELQEKMKVALEEAREKDKMLFHQNKLASMGEMMQNIAHQWRQPLSEVNSAVLVIDDILESKGVKDEMLEEKLFEIEKLTNYMSKTISDFKEFYSPGKYKKLFILQELIQEALIIVQGTLKEKNIFVFFEDRRQFKCYSYKNELQQVLVIILNNAIEAFEKSRKKEKNISINIDERSSEFVISICDEAGGINEEILEKIFEPYFTTKHMAQGTGLGLYIAKLIVEESVKGTLEVKNVGQGACFSIYLRK